MAKNGAGSSIEKRLVAAMRSAAECSECRAAIPGNGRHAAPNLGVFTCNRCYGIFREGRSIENSTCYIWTSSSFEKGREYMNVNNLIVNNDG